MSAEKDTPAGNREMLFGMEEGTDRGCPGEVEPTEQDCLGGNGASILVRAEGADRGPSISWGIMAATRAIPGGPGRTPGVAGPLRHRPLPAAVSGRGVR